MPSPQPGPILVVDDDEEFLSFLQTSLLTAGYEVEAVGTAQAARARIAARGFALLLTDLRLPAASGIDLVKEARQLHPLTVGMIISGHGSVDAALEALREGAYDFLLKPCPADVVLAAVRRALGHHELLRELIRKTAVLESVERQLERKSRLLYDVSHEFRNPLAVVTGYSSFLLKSKPEAIPPQELERNLRFIHHSAKRLDAMIEDLLASARLAGGKLELKRRALDAGRLAAEAVEMHGLQASQRGVSLAAEGPVGPGPAVDGDEGKVQQVLGNLVDNALKFTPAGGSVRVSVDADGGFARFTVRDTGPGLSAEQAARVFERFYQCGEEDGRQGLGLGLEICRGLVELHGGRIWVDSEPGAGCAFRFTLPLVPRLQKLQ